MPAKPSIYSCCIPTQLRTSACTEWQPAWVKTQLHWRKFWNSAYSGIGPIAANLTKRLDALKSLAEKIEWAVFRPAVHYLDWRLRMMPVLPPQDTFVFHAKEYRTAANLLRDTNALLQGALVGNRDQRETRPAVRVTTTATLNPELNRIGV